MTIQNPRWLIDDNPASSFVLGRRVSMAIDVLNFSGGDLTFELYKSTLISDVFERLFQRTMHVDQVGTTPKTIVFPVVLNYPWRILNCLATLVSLGHRGEEGRMFTILLMLKKFKTK